LGTRYQLPSRLIYQRFILDLLADFFRWIYIEAHEIGGSLMSDRLIDALDKALESGEAEPTGFQPQAVDLPPPIPEATPLNLACIRGPCKHYFETVEIPDLGNPDGTPGVIRRSRSRFCSFSIGGEGLELTDSTILQCSHWDPVDTDDPEWSEREERRGKWEDANLDLHERIQTLLREGGNGTP
jgi:hypothetical protein